MYLEIRHKNNGFHTTQMFPSGNYDMGNGTTYAAQPTHRLLSWEGGRAIRTKRSLTIPLFIGTLVSWRLRPVHNGRVFCCFSEQRQAEGGREETSC